MRFALASLAVVGACSAPSIDPLPLGNWTPHREGTEEPESKPLSRPTSLPADMVNMMPLELEGLIRLAGEKPLSIQVARARAQAAAAEKSVAFTKWLPELRPRARFYRNEGRLQNTLGKFLDVDKQRSFAGGALDPSVDLSEVFYQNLAATHRKNAAMLGILATQHLEVGKAVTLYYDLLESQSAYRITVDLVAQAIELVAVQEARLEQGKGLRARVLRAKAFHAEAIGRRVRAEALVKSTNARLCALLLLPPETDLVPADRVEPITFPESKRSLVHLVEMAQRNRPDLQGAQSLIEAADTERRQARYSWLWPRLAAGTDYDWFGPVPARWSDRQEYYAEVQWRWSFGRIAQARVADARHREQELRAAQLKRSIIAQVQIAKADLTAAIQSMEAAGLEIEASAEAYRLVQQQAKEGSALLVEVLDAARAFTEANIKLVRAVNSHNKAQFALRRAVGG